MMHLVSPLYETFHAAGQLELVWEDSLWIRRKADRQVTVVPRFDTLEPVIYFGLGPSQYNGTERADV